MQLWPIGRGNDARERTTCAITLLADNRAHSASKGIPCWRGGLQGNCVRRRHVMYVPPAKHREFVGSERHGVGRRTEQSTSFFQYPATAVEEHAVEFRSNDKRVVGLPGGRTKGLFIGVLKRGTRFQSCPTNRNHVDAGHALEVFDYGGEHRGAFGAQ